MLFYFLNFHPILQSLCAGCFTFFITAFGSAIVIFFKTIHKSIMDSMLAISAGIMLAASFFSLLNPAIEIANQLHMITWFVILVGFCCGGLLLYFGNQLLDFYTKKIHKRKKQSFRRCMMLFTSITLHNIPEGLVLGVAYASVPLVSQSTNIAAAIALTIGIAIQNFPEGSAISLPMRRDGFSRFHSFLFGSFSAIVEPVFACIGAALVLKIQSILPFVLSFTAGAMIFVTVLELIPESQSNPKKGLMTLLHMLGFSIMMILELVLG